MTRFASLAVLTAGLLATTACDYAGDFLFPELVEDVPHTIDLGILSSVDITSAEDAAAAAQYGQISSTGEAIAGGITFGFEGTGSDVCVFVDPEFIAWNQSVAARGGTRRWRYPDDNTDDGDLDLEVGLAIYYNGTPGQRVGDFAIRYEDALGNPIELELNECIIPTALTAGGGHAGRGAPEFCTIRNTQPGVTYITKMETWSTPIDDDRLGYGFILANGDCDELLAVTLGTDSEDTSQQFLLECLITGEAIDWEVAGGEGPWYGADGDVPTLDGAADFEANFCSRDVVLSEACEAEALEKDCEDAEVNCFCGDPTDTPSGGTF